MLDPRFVADCPYAAEAILFDEITELDREAGRLVAHMPTHDRLPLTDLQRADPVRHPRHGSGALMVHLTAMLGFAHAYYVLGLRHAEDPGEPRPIHRVNGATRLPHRQPVALPCRQGGPRFHARRGMALRAVGGLEHAVGLAEPPRHVPPLQDHGTIVH